MKKRKLEALRVSSFVTNAQDVKAGRATLPDPNDPTANTWCYVCPEFKEEY